MSHRFVRYTTKVATTITNFISEMCQNTEGKNICNFRFTLFTIKVTAHMNPNDIARGSGTKVVTDSCSAPVRLKLFNG